jgi:hypothetical protein
VPLDLDGSLSFAAMLADELGRHVEGALDMRRSFSDRQASAFEACELLARTGALDKLRQARTWIAANRTHLDRALKLAGFVRNLRGH